MVKGARAGRTTSCNLTSLPHPSTIHSPTSNPADNPLKCPARVSTESSAACPESPASVILCSRSVKLSSMHLLSKCDAVLGVYRNLRGSMGEGIHKSLSFLIINLRLLSYTRAPNTISREFNGGMGCININNGPLNSRLAEFS